MTVLSWDELKRGIRRHSSGRRRPVSVTVLPWDELKCVDELFEPQGRHSFSDSCAVGRVETE